MNDVGKFVAWLGVRGNLIVGLGVLLFFLCFSWLSISRHYGLKSNMNDLGNMDQPIFNTLQGDFMRVTNIPGERVESMNRFAGHANFVLLLFVPIYAIAPHPEILLITQVFVVSLGAVALYLLGRELFGDRSALALLGPFGYLLNPVVHDAVLYDFHPIVMGMSISMFAFYFLYTRRDRAFLLSVFLLLILKEDMPLLVVMMGLYAVFVLKRRLFGVGVFLLGFVYFLFLTQVLMPALSNGVDMSAVGERYAHLGGSLGAVATTIITKPLFVLGGLLTPLKFTYLAIVLGSFAFTSLIGLEVFLLALPSLLINLLSLSLMMNSPLRNYYSAPVMAFVFLSGLVGVYRLRGVNLRFGRRLSIIASALAVYATVVFSLMFSPAPYSLTSSFEDFRVSEHDKKVSVLKNIIPDGASLSVQNNLGAHFSQRKNIASFPYRSREFEYVLLDISNPYSGRETRRFMFTVQMSMESYRESVVGMFDDPRYEVDYFTEDGYLLFKRGGDKKVDKRMLAFDMFEERMAYLEGQLEQ